MLRRTRHAGLAIALATISCTAPCAAGDRLSAFIDPEDGKFDTSEWLLDRKGFLPVPIVVTEPAVGYGGGAALLFFRESIRDAAARASGGHVTPPDIYGAAGFATENGTWGGGAGALLTFAEDRWRYRGGVARAEVNLDFFGIGGNLRTGERKIAYTLDGWVSSQQALRRLGGSNHFLGARWVYIDLDSEFDTDDTLPVLEDFEHASVGSGLGVSWEFDSRNNIFTPSRGMFAVVESLFYDPDWGSDNRFETYRAHVFAYWPFAGRFVFGMRLDGRAARGEVPFYQLPYIEIRGIPALRYQDESVAVAETELRWNLTPRWSLIGFVGAGRAWGRDHGFDDVDTEVAQGGGFRYLIARRLGLYVGVDVGWGPEEEAIYLQVGSAWR